MPVPKPKEKEDEFIARCMNYPDLQKYPRDQRAAICFSIWRKHKKKKKKADEMIGRICLPGKNQSIDLSSEDK